MSEADPLEQGGLADPLERGGLADPLSRHFGESRNPGPPGENEHADPLGPAVAEAGGSEGRRGRAVALVALAVALAVAVLLLVLALGDPQRGTLIGRSAVGEPAPRIVGETLTGDFFDLDDHRGRWVVVNFFATWCAGCIIEHPELVAFSERHAGSEAGGVAGGAGAPLGAVEPLDAIVVTVAFDDSPAAVRAFFERAGGDWPVLAGDVGSVPVDYGVTAVPETYLVSPAGYVVDKLVGASGVTADQLDARIAAFESLSTPDAIAQ